MEFHENTGEKSKLDDVPTATENIVNVPTATGTNEGPEDDGTERGG